MDALAGVYMRNVLGYPSTAIIPYSQALSRLPAHLQQFGYGEQREKSRSTRVSGGNRVGSLTKAGTLVIIPEEGPGTNNRARHFQFFQGFLAFKGNGIIGPLSGLIRGFRKRFPPGTGEGDYQEIGGRGIPGTRPRNGKLSKGGKTFWAGPPGFGPGNFPGPKGGNQGKGKFKFWPKQKNFFEGGKTRGPFLSSSLVPARTKALTPLGLPPREANLLLGNHFSKKPRGGLFPQGIFSMGEPV